MNFYDIHTHSAHPDIGFVALHPWNVTADNARQLLSALRNEATSPDVLAIGEAGLDKRCSTPYDLQLQVFREVVSIARQVHKPLIIHCVKASNDIIVLRKEMRCDNPWIIHGFRGNPHIAQSLLAAGCYLSFGERYNPEALRGTPLQRMFIETDTSPLPISQIYARIADTRQIPLAALVRQVQDNVHSVFLSHHGSSIG